MGDIVVHYGSPRTGRLADVVLRSPAGALTNTGPTVLSEGLRRLLNERAEASAAIERLAGELAVLPESRPLDAFLPRRTGAAAPRENGGAIDSHPP